MAEKYQRYEGARFCGSFEFCGCCGAKSGIMTPDEVKKRCGGAMTFSAIRQALHDPNLPLDMVGINGENGMLGDAVFGLAISFKGENRRRDSIFTMGVNGKETEGAHCAALRTDKNGKKYCSMKLKDRPISCARMNPDTCMKMAITGVPAGDDGFDEYIYQEWNDPKIQQLLGRVLLKETGLNGMGAAIADYAKRWAKDNLDVDDLDKVDPERAILLMAAASKMLDAK